jgi:hypothetical protein
MDQIPKATRSDGEKLFMGELTKTSNAGKASPGPVYMFSDNVKYDQVSIFYHLHNSKSSKEL